MKRHLTLTLACAAFCAVAGSASAVALVPGGAVLTGGAATIPGTILASATDPVAGVNALGENRFNGFLTALVVQEVSGTLDFWYQYANTGTPTSLDGVERLTMTGFAGFTTDVNWLNDNSGTQMSTFADRSSDGTKVGFSFSPSPIGAGLIQPGATSNWVVIRTDATEFTEGTTSVIDGGVATVDTFAPEVVPEPASMLAIGVGIVGLLRRRLKARA